MRKNILLPASFLLDVCRLIIILNDAGLDGPAKSLCSALESKIKDKLAAMDRHDAFAKYKAASPGSGERELRRREYLDIAGIHDDWRSDKEMLP